MFTTKRIEIYINENDKDLRKEYRSRLFKILDIARRFANICSSHLYFVDNLSQFLYLTSETKCRLSDPAQDDSILLKKYNSIMWELSKTLPDSDRKGITKILADIATRCTKLYNAKVKGSIPERYKIDNGEVSVRNYKENMPIPFSKQAINISKDEKDYIFTFFGIPFKTKCGRDRSNNRGTLDKVISGEINIGDSSIQYKKVKDRETGKFENKWYLLLCVEQSDCTSKKVDKNTILKADLNVIVPIIVTVNENSYNIGSAEEFLYQRIRIQDKLHRLQKALRYAGGGNGRKSKLQAIERFKEKEKNYIKTKLHTYSAILISTAVKNDAGKIVLVNQIFKEEEAKKNEMLLRNWSYYGLKQMIKYKASRNGIEVEEQDLIFE